MEDIEQEVWRDIEGYEGYYQVSDLGRVKSLDRMIWGGYSFYEKKGQVLKPKVNKDGYAEVNLNKNGKGYSKKVHRLVAEAFIPNPESLPQVNHKKEFEKTNNRVENLEWCTSKYNINYGTHNERVKITQSNRVAQYDLDFNLIKIWNGTNEPTEEGFFQSAIYDCCIGKFKQYKGYIWKFYDEDYQLNKEDYEYLPKKIYQYDMDLNFIKLWNNTEEIVKEGLASRSFIKRCCSGEKSSCNKYIWSYIPLIHVPSNIVSKRVYQYDLKLNLVNSWDTTKEASEYGFDKSCISECLNDKVKSHKGYIWSYNKL